MDSSAYHLEELAIGQRLDDPARILPPISGRDRRILDVGCGAGQTLIVSNLDSGVMACGVDVDFSALALGKGLTRSVQFVCAKGESLPLQSDYFDRVICRVAMPYMHIPSALAEIGRVLRAGGSLWLVLHAPSMTMREVMANVYRLRLKGAVYRLYALANGIALHFLGKQFHLPLAPHRCESCQTTGGIRKALRRAGFESIDVRRDTFFVVTAQKAAAPHGRSSID